MIGKTVSHYKILEKIGEGGMGEIFLAEDTKLQRKVALKFLPADLTKDESRKQRFIQEARAAASMEHPNIAAVYDIDEVEGRTFIAMEYVRGESLRQTIREQKLSVRRALELGSQVAEGLAKAHERGVVHRDLKPENVLLSEDGYAKIIDFGLAKLAGPLSAPEGEPDVEHEAETLVKTQEGLVLGTIAYMSPEQARAKAVDARTDIFSLGVVLHELLTGKAPFNRGSVAETLSAILKESPPALPDEVTTTSPELQPVLRKALAKDPDGRYARMKDLASDLKEIREELGSGVRSAFAGLRLPRRLQNVALGIIAVGLAAVSLYLLRDDSQPGIGASGRPAIAVMYFEDNTGSEEIRWLSKGLPNMLLTDLAQTPGLDVVSRQRILEILKQIGEDNLEAVDASLIPEVARQAGAGAVVGGSIYKVGDDIRIDVQVEDVGSGRILSAHSVRGNDVFPLVDELSGRIRASLDMTDAPTDRGIAEVTTASLEAYRDRYRSHFRHGLLRAGKDSGTGRRIGLERRVQSQGSRVHGSAARKAKAAGRGRESGRRR
jgi:TolB-like protein/predicted Ser/Thr protein kinase